MSAEGVCSIDGYINNLAPRDHPVNAPLYASLERLFEHCLPFIESVYSYIWSIRPNLRDEGDDTDSYMQSVGRLAAEPYCHLRGQKLQVITKIVDYELQPDQIHSSVWHVEGMSHEEIILTALYIVDRDADIEGASIEFKRGFFRDEVGCLASDTSQERPLCMDEVAKTGILPLGTVDTIAGRLIVFPNSHVHKVSDMFSSSTEVGSIKRRRIVVFFLVNPLRRIVSTKEVAPQQVALGGDMEHADALEHRQNLMHERRHTKQDWNVREVHLCEH